MRSVIEAIQQAADSTVSGRKLEKPAFVMEGRCLGPASSEPDRSRHLGVVEAMKIPAPPDDPNRERPDPWKDMPAWVKAGDLG